MIRLLGVPPSCKHSLILNIAGNAKKSIYEAEFNQVNTVFFSPNYNSQLEGFYAGNYIACDHVVCYTAVFKSSRNALFSEGGRYFFPLEPKK